MNGIAGSKAKFICNFDQCFQIAFHKAYNNSYVIQESKIVLVYQHFHSPFCGTGLAGGGGRVRGKGELCLLGSAGLPYDPKTPGQPTPSGPGAAAAAWSVETKVMPPIGNQGGSSYDL